MLFERVLLSCVLVGAATARTLQVTLLENILVTGTAFTEKPSDFIELKSPLPTAAKSPEREVVATAAAAPSPTQPGLISTCNAYYRVQRGDYCATVVDKFYALTLNEFYAWNPAVKPDCSELLDGYYVCVGISDSSPSPAVHPTAASGLQARAEAIPSPIQSGIANNCDKYYKVVPDDTCVGVAYQHGITLSQFYSWNPAVGYNCQVLLAGYYVCVGVSGMPPSPISLHQVPKVEQSAKATIKKP
ncbi:Peptidoglycan-binding Lysin subgroup [Penicillium occitanis (nom. inval.)]|nr:Peptidoglycan-binding Lysin subgroup [Penicillium occitanis (nom. inval.)]PCH04321.1 hypothetical protein PENOC_034210 [Penicillium occitanis (nom. inval.)]